MFRVIIMEIKESYIVAMKEGGKLIRLNKKDGLEVGDAIFCLDEDIYKQNVNIKGSNINYKNWFISLGTVAAVMIILINPIINMFSPSINNLYAVLTFDVNPSIEFSLDDNGKIISVKGLNDDGIDLDIKGLKGLTLEEGTIKLREILTNENYLGNGNSVLVGFSFLNGDNTEFEEMVQNAVKTTFMGTNVAFIKGNEQSLNMAKEQGVSLGKYEAMSLLDEDGIEETFENLSTQELLDLLKINNSNVFLDDDALDELQDEIEDRMEDESSDNNENYDSNDNKDDGNENDNDDDSLDDDNNEDDNLDEDD